MNPFVPLDDASAMRSLESWDDAQGATEEQREIGSASLRGSRVREQCGGSGALSISREARARMAENLRHILVDLRALPVFRDANGAEVILSQDAVDLMSAALLLPQERPPLQDTERDGRQHPASGDNEPPRLELDWSAFEPSREAEVPPDASDRVILGLADGSHMRVKTPGREGRAPVERGAMLRNLITRASEIAKYAPQERRTTTTSSLQTRVSVDLDLHDGSTTLHEYAKAQLKRTSHIRQGLQRDFANSASYMGAKRPLAPFLLEAVAPWTPEDSVFVDLMCGSGAATAVFSRYWPTYASDAQRFCQLLACVQSGGYSRTQAEFTLQQVRSAAMRSIGWLEERLAPALEREDWLFHFKGREEDLVAAYEAFLKDVPTYPGGGRLSGWDPVREVDLRQQAPDQQYPSCLFTAYFANLYVGLRQAIEIDSLRAAIAQLANPLDQRWALGALIAALSAVATTYGGHFAQPIISKPLTSIRLRKTLKARLRSVLREFEVRLLNLGAQSEGITYRAGLLDGPWQTALGAVENEVGSKPVTVYLDAPYRRHEYSRYYHVLETLVTYNYPSAISAAKLPDKRSGERFRSEFFTRNREKMRSALTATIDAVIERGWTCAWSYSDAADALVTDVLQHLECAPRQLRSYSTSYAYKRQGRHSRDREVTEYLLLLQA